MSEPESELDVEGTVSADTPLPPGPVDPPPGGRFHTPPPPIRLFRSEELFGGSRIVCIEHAGATYRLQITARGKLILQK
jgi:hemin uptake protein HemP